MWNRAIDQIEAIQAMMSTGQRSVQMERHSLILWGLTAAFLILTVPLLFSPDRFAASWQRILAANSFITFVLVVMAIWDFHLTQQARAARDETLSFIQVQLTKVWWLILGLIVLINTGMNIFGGGMLFYPILLSLTGLAFYIQGLFSRQLLSWAGIVMILLGLGAGALRLPLATMEWLTIVVFGLGMPTLGIFINRTTKSKLRLLPVLFFAGWLGFIVLAVVLIKPWNRNVNPPDLPLVLFDDFQKETSLSKQIVRLPAGTVVPVEVKVTGDVLAQGATAVVPLQLAEDLDVVVENGIPDGRFRDADDVWKQRRFHYRIKDFKLSSTIQPGRGPKVRLEFHVSTRGEN